MINITAVNKNVHLKVYMRKKKETAKISPKWENNLKKYQ